MSKKRMIIIGVVLLIVAVAAVILLQRQSNSPAPTASVEITQDGFVPNSLQVKPGTKVTWVNKDSAPHQVASNPHPEHTDLPGLVSGDLGPNTAYSYTFTKSGTFGYHDEANSTINGTVIVK